MKILVIGGSGLVGSRFIELYSPKYPITVPGYPEFDLTKKETLKEAIAETKPDAVIHFAAYTDVSAAETQRGDKKADCWRVNVKGVENLVSLINPGKTHFIHISTDYVFPGSKETPGPYPEDRRPENDSGKLTWYGYTKKLAEDIAEKYLGEERTVLRLIYPVRARFPQKLDYLRKPLSLFDQGKLYPMFKDQQVSITFIDEACLALAKIIEEKTFGTFHASTPDLATPFELVSYLIEKVRGVKNVVKPTTLTRFLKVSGSSPVRYPKYGGLKVEKTQRELGIKFSPWRKVIETLAATY